MYIIMIPGIFGEVLTVSLVLGYVSITGIRPRQTEANQQ